jgi:hypothetical protein
MATIFIMCFLSGKAFGGNDGIPFINGGRWIASGPLCRFTISEGEVFLDEAVTDNGEAED